MMALHKDTPDTFWDRMRLIHGDVEPKPIRLWHDDIRRPPSDEWVWCRTNSDAERVLSTFAVYEISLDHDLGCDGLDPDLPYAIYLKGSSEQTGLDLVDWMIANDKVPRRITIHSWNPEGAKRMRATFAAAGYHADYSPYTVSA